MRFEKRIILKNGKEACIRNAEGSDAKDALENYNATHSETDYLLCYPEENNIELTQEAEYLKEKAESSNEIEMIAFVDGRVVGMAGVAAVGTKYKVRHRAEFGISILKEYWGIGIGKALTEACIQCAKDAGYTQLELEVVADNDRAVAMYKKIGFEEFGRNKKGFRSPINGYQELVGMMMEL